MLVQNKGRAWDFQKVLGERWTQKFSKIGTTKLPISSLKTCNKPMPNLKTTQH
jgi:hypothetical protein